MGEEGRQEEGGREGGPHQHHFCRERRDGRDGRASPEEVSSLPGRNSRMINCSRSRGESPTELGLGGLDPGVGEPRGHPLQNRRRFSARTCPSWRQGDAQDPMPGHSSLQPWLGAHRDRGDCQLHQAFFLALPPTLCPHPRVLGWSWAKARELGGKLSNGR